MPFVAFETTLEDSDRHLSRECAMSFLKGHFL